MTMVNQRANEQSGANDVLPDIPTERSHSPAIKLATSALGTAETRKEQVQAIAKVIRANPQWQEEIIKFFHNNDKFGNSFVAMVLAENSSPEESKSDGNAPAPPPEAPKAAASVPEAKSQSEAPTQAAPPAPTSDTKQETAPPGKDPTTAVSPRESPAISYVQMCIRNADDDRETVLRIYRGITKHPEWRSEILRYLREVDGQQFVGDVLKLEQQLPGGEPPGGFKAPGTLGGAHKAAADEALNDARELDPPKETVAKSSKDAAPPAPSSQPQVAEATQAALPAPVAAESQQAAPPAPAQENAPPAKNDIAPATQDGPQVKAPPAPAESNAQFQSSQEVAPPQKPEKQDISPATQEAPALKAEDKAAVEKGKEEKPDEKAQGDVKITASALRVRAEPSLKGHILGKLTRGTVVTPIGREREWLKIEFHGQQAFIHSKYTAGVKGNESGEEEEAEHDEGSQAQKQERPKAPPPVNDEAQQQQNERV